MAIKRRWIQENKWTCPYCGSTQLGRDNKCRGCGAVKGAKVQDTVPAPAPETAVTYPELLKIARGGQDWACEYCGSKVRNAKGQCGNCSGPRHEPVPPSDPVPPEPEPIRPERPRVRSAPRRYEAPEPQKDRTVPVVALVAGGGVLFVCLMVWLFTSHEIHTTVGSTNWKYVSELHQKITTHGSDWEPVRSDAFNKRCEERLYGHEDCHCRQVQSGTHQESYDCNCTSYECNCRQSCRDLGNGFSDCSETCSTCSRCSTCYNTVQDYREECDSCPVYKQFCEYDFYEWPVVATKTTEGSRHDEHWPDLRAIGPDQRLDQAETYSVSFVEADSTAYVHTPHDLGAFQKFVVGDRWSLYVNHFGSIDTTRMKKE